MRCSFFRKFFSRQCCATVFVSLASQVRSFASSRISAVAKNLTLLGAGLPNGFSSRAITRIATSYAWQLSTQAACSAVSRAGGCPSSARNRCWSSLISAPCQLHRDLTRKGGAPGRRRRAAARRIRRPPGEAPHCLFGELPVKGRVNLGPPLSRRRNAPDLTYQASV